MKELNKKMEKEIRRWNSKTPEKWKYKTQDKLKNEEKEQQNSTKIHLPLPSCSQSLFPAPLCWYSKPSILDFAFV